MTDYFGARASGCETGNGLRLLIDLVSRDPSWELESSSQKNLSSQTASWPASNEAERVLAPGYDDHPPARREPCLPACGAR